MVFDRTTDATTTLADALLPSDFSRDGQTLLGRIGKTYAIVTCAAPQFDCTPIMDGESTVDGAIPRWSHDEQRVYFRRARRDRPGYADIWVVDRAGGPPSRVAEIGPYDPRSVFFGITADEQILWNRFDADGASELWSVTLAP